MTGHKHSVHVTDEAGKTRIIKIHNIIWMLVVGWMFYIVSMVLHCIYYIMHPSSPDIWSCGNEEQLEEWTPPEETQPQEEEGEFGPSICNHFLAPTGAQEVTMCVRPCVRSKLV